MLILVGVTINVALNGSLFTTAQSAATNTMVEAEREQLLSAVATAYDTETGTINKSKLESNLGTGWNVVGNEGGPYTVTSPKGNKYTVNANGAIDYTGNSGGSDINDNSIVGTYYSIEDITDFSGMNMMEFKSDGKIVIKETGIDSTTGEEMIENLENMSATYTYDSNSKTGKIILKIEDEDSTTGEISTEIVDLPFEYIEIMNKSNEVVNEILDINMEGLEGLAVEPIHVPYLKYRCEGLIPLEDNIYENGTSTIEFNKEVVDGNTYGIYIFKKDSSTIEGNYLCYNGKIMWAVEDHGTITTISEDYSTITLSDGTVYTLKQ